MIRYHSQSGFTLVEMLVSLTLFTIVATVATGTLLSLIGSNSRLVAEQTVMSGLSFALDSMSREIRTGSEYYCGTGVQVAAAGVTGSATNVQDCPGTGNAGISFREGGQSLTSGVSVAKRIAYYYDTNTDTIMRQVGGQSPTPLLDSDEIEVTSLRFYVEGTEPLTEVDPADDAVQPNVTIVIKARSRDTDLDREFVVQTSITQRALDI